jgi:hypothetical protein
MNVAGESGTQMDNEFSNAIVQWFLPKLAFSIGATEAFAFGIRGEGVGERFPLLAHIRPDRASEEMRRAARNAFIEIATPCVREGKNGAIQLRSTGIEDRGRDRQFCLVVLVPAAGDVRVARAMLGFIARFPDLPAAKAALQRVQTVSPDESRD